jgi:hypothetical protein
MFAHNNRAPFMIMVYNYYELFYLQIKRNTSPWGSICLGFVSFIFYFQNKCNTCTFKVNATSIYFQGAFTLKINSTKRVINEIITTILNSVSLASVALFSEL